LKTESFESWNDTLKSDSHLTYNRFEKRKKSSQDRQERIRWKELLRWSKKRK